MNGHAPSSFPPGGFSSSSSHLNGQKPELSDQHSASKPNAKALYEQRKHYTKNSINSLTDTSQYHVEHLTTFVMDRKEAVITVEDGIRKLKLLDAKAKVWTQDMILQVDKQAIILIDIETTNELEHFPLSTVQYCQAVIDACSYDSILALVCKEPGQSKPDLHLFQCDDIKANLIHADIESAISDLKGGKAKKRPDTLRMILNSDGVIPPPPSDPAPAPPATVTQVDVKSRVAAWSAWAANEQPDYEKVRQYLEQDYTPEDRAARVDRDVQILNHLLDDIEHFVMQLQRAAEAFNELSKRKKTKKTKKKGPGEGVLTLRSKPPSQEEFVDCFQKFKHAFNMLGSLKTFIQNPSAEELVHFLFTPLNMVVQASGGVDLARSVLSPLLTREAIEFLHGTGTPTERHLWVSLGDGWTKCRLEWPKDHDFPPYTPHFRTGWEPPPLVPDVCLKSVEAEKREVQRLEEMVPMLVPEHPLQDLSNPNSGFKQMLPLDHELALADFEQAIHQHIDRNYESHSVSQLHSFAKSKYDFVARNGTELSVLKDEILEVLDDKKQWWKVRNASGALGYVPNNILEITRLVDVSSGQGDPIYSHTIQLMMPKKEFELFKKQRMDIPKPTMNPVPPPPAPPNSIPVPTRIPTPPLLPPAAPPLVEQVVPPTAGGGNSSSPECGSVALREHQKECAPPANRRKSNMEEVQDELLYRLTLGRSAQKKIQVPPRSAPSASITYESSPGDVKAWLQSKGFSDVTVNSLGVLTGAQLFSLNKDELKTVCPEDGARVYSQVTVQKAALEMNGGSELQEIMRRRQEKLNAPGSDSGVESFDESSGH